MFQIKFIEKTKTHILCSIPLFWGGGNHTVYEKMWKNTVERGRPHDNMAQVRCSWIPRATNRHTKYIIIIVFPLQQWSQERASRYVIRTLPVLFHDTSVCIQLWTNSYILRQPETIVFFDWTLCDSDIPCVVLRFQDQCGKLFSRQWGIGYDRKFLYSQSLQQW